MAFKSARRFRLHPICYFHNEMQWVPFFFFYYNFTILYNSFQSNYYNIPHRIVYPAWFLNVALKSTKPAKCVYVHTYQMNLLSYTGYALSGHFIRFTCTIRHSTFGIVTLIMFRSCWNCVKLIEFSGNFCGHSYWCRYIRLRCVSRCLQGAF